MNRHRISRTRAVLGLLLGIFVPAVRAHELKPALLEIQEHGPGRYTFLWKTTAADRLEGARPVLPPGCIPISDTREAAAGSVVERLEVSRPGGLAGQPLAIGGATASLLDVLVRYVPQDGPPQLARITPDRPVVSLAARPDAWAQAATFLRLGLEHILKGIDHLLFVLGLVLLVRERWMLFQTITAFTIAHSLTLAAATLGWAHAPGPPLNAAIALSILFLGPEMVRRIRGGTSLTLRQPWLVAFAFGLLHGFGFASGLVDLGLSRGEIPRALLLFNVGVEAGQLLFVGLIFALVAAWHVLEVRWPSWARWMPPYVVGSLGAYWTLQRTWLLFVPS